MNPRVMTNCVMRSGSRRRKKERGRHQGSQQETENDTLHQFNSRSKNPDFLTDPAADPCPVKHYFVRYGITSIIGIPDPELQSRHRKARSLPCRLKP
jgi:hypothetical protein